MAVSQASPFVYWDTLVSEQFPAVASIDRSSLRSVVLTYKAATWVFSLMLHQVRFAVFMPVLANMNRTAHMLSRRLTEIVGDAKNVCVAENRIDIRCTP